MNLDVDSPEPDYDECVFGPVNVNPCNIADTKVDWKECLITLDNSLDNNDIDNLKFLLKGVLKDVKLQKIKRGTFLFQELHHATLINIENGDFHLLEECLYRIHRKDLIRKLGGKDPNKVKERLHECRLEIRANADPRNQIHILSPFRVMLFEIGEDIDDNEFESAMFTLGALVPKGQLTKMKSVFDLLLYLEKKDELSAENTRILPKVLKAIDRSDLIEKVNSYQNNFNKTTSKSAAPPILASQHLPNVKTRQPHYQMMQEPQMMPRQQSLQSPRRFHPTVDVSENIENSEPMTPLTAGTESPTGSLDYNRLSVNRQRSAGSRKISDATMLHLAVEIGKDDRWPSVVSDLNVSQCDIDEIKRKKNVRRTSGLVLQILHHWQDKVLLSSENGQDVLLEILQKYNIESAVQLLGGQTQQPVPDQAVLPTETVNPPPSALVTETETQTSMPVLSHLIHLPEHDQELPNRSVSNAEAQVSIQPPPAETQQTENLTVKSVRDMNNMMQEEVLTRQLRQTFIDDDLELPSYKMNAKPRGIAVIINNMNFFKIPRDRESKEMPPRTGTDKDAANLEYIFNKLEFIVLRYDDLQDFEIVRKLVEISYNYNHAQYDCLVVCILSHGVLGNIYGTNGRLVKIQDCTACFRAQMCPGLAGKPKLFFIQACQGRDKQRGQEIEQDSDLEQDNGPREMIPDEADFVLGYATVPGYVSYRSRTQGSWYVNKLVQMLDRYAYQFDLLSILVKVNEEVGRADARLDGGHYKQIPAPLVTLRKKLFFR